MGALTRDRGRGLLGVIAGEIQAASASRPNLKPRAIARLVLAASIDAGNCVPPPLAANGIMPRRLWQPMDKPAVHAAETEVLVPMMSQPLLMPLSLMVEKRLTISSINVAQIATEHWR